MKKILNTAVIVAALGYFVDIYDLLLFGFVRTKSLLDMGLSAEAITDVGISLQNWQMFGMLIGGVLTGILGDKKGRVSVLYLSIFLYSVANILNGFVQNVEQYAALRFLAGLGLAGELGVGITLVAESLPKEKRGYGTTIVAAVGLLGAILAGFINRWFDWRTCYFIGGGLGFLLLALRLSVAESGIFEKMKQQEGIVRGDFLSIFRNWDLFKRFARCLMIGFPTWFVVGILILLSPEFGREKGLEGISAGTAIMCCYVALAIGDIVAGLTSQYLKSRLKVVGLYLLGVTLVVFWHLSGDFVTVNSFYFSHFLLGFVVGYWVIFVTLSAEQFGSNIRATVATTVPNFARAMLIPIAWSFQYLKSAETGFGSMTSAAYVVGAVCILIAFLGLWGMEETFDKDLDYVEQNL